MCFSRLVLSILIVLFLTPSLQAADIEAGKNRASQCFGCHGADGISLNPKYPNLGGQSAEYLSKQLNAFRSGERSDPFMTPMVTTMSDADVENVSAFFASKGIRSAEPISTGGEREEITAAAAKILAPKEAMYQRAASGVPCRCRTGKPGAQTDQRPEKRNYQPMGSVRWRLPTGH